MKKFILIALVVLFGLITKAQGHTLAFNQGLLLLNNVTYTVPTGKIWKIVSAASSSAVTTSNSMVITPQGGSAVTIILATYTSPGSASLSLSTFNTLPMWLPEGTSIKPAGLINMVTAIEFVVN